MNKDNCPECGAELHKHYMSSHVCLWYACGTMEVVDGSFTISKQCFQNQIESLKNALNRQQDKYPKALATIRKIAKEHGYAIGLHGSEARDLDLIATPWIIEACDPEILIKHITDAVGGCVKPSPYKDPNILPNPENKPHGRIAWGILADGGYIDLSVYPKLEDGYPKSNKKEVEIK